jgi:hypothetical protein
VAGARGSGAKIAVFRHNSKYLFVHLLLVWTFDVVVHVIIIFNLLFNKGKYVVLWSTVASQ